MGSNASLVANRVFVYSLELVAKVDTAALAEVLLSVTDRGDKVSDFRDSQRGPRPLNEAGESSAEQELVNFTASADGSRGLWVRRGRTAADGMHACAEPVRGAHRGTDGRLSASVTGKGMYFV